MLKAGFVLTPITVFIIDCSGWPSGAACCLFFSSWSWLPLPTSNTETMMVTIPATMVVLVVLLTAFHSPSTIPHMLATRMIKAVCAGSRNSHRYPVCFLPHSVKRTGETRWCQPALKTGSSISTVFSGLHSRRMSYYGRSGIMVQTRLVLRPPQSNILHKSHCCGREIRLPRMGCFPGGIGDITHGLAGFETKLKQALSTPEMIDTSNPKSEFVFSANLDAVGSEASSCESCFSFIIPARPQITMASTQITSPARTTRPQLELIISLNRSFPRLRVEVVINGRNQESRRPYKTEDNAAAQGNSQVADPNP